MGETLTLDEAYAILDKFVQDNEDTLQPGDITRQGIMERYGKDYHWARRMYDTFKRQHPEYTEVTVRINGVKNKALRKAVSSVT